MPSRGKRVTLLLATVAVVVLGVATWLSWPHIVFRLRFEPLGKNEQGYLEYRHRQTGIVMVRLPGGTFWMGGQEDDPEGQNYYNPLLTRDDPDLKVHWGPVHEVRVGSFLIGKNEITQTLWRHVMGWNKSETQGADLPVDWVTWHDCQEFCRKTGLSLPTETQWEYACRAGTSGAFAGTGNLDDMGWYEDNSEDDAHSVGQKQPNAFGLHDMHGNVAEWCEDFKAYPYWVGEQAWANEYVRPTASRRVQRGGNYGLKAWSASSFARDNLKPERGLCGVGFRVAYPLP